MEGIASKWCAARNCNSLICCHAHPVRLLKPISAKVFAGINRFGGDGASSLIWNLSPEVKAQARRGQLVAWQ
jgi:hypothetical protein